MVVVGLLEDVLRTTNCPDAEEGSCLALKPPGMRLSLVNPMFPRLAWTVKGAISSNSSRDKLLIDLVWQVLVCGIIVDIGNN